MALSYVTLVSTDNYVLGALVLKASLVSVKSKYGLLALLSPSVSQESEAKLRSFGLTTKRLTETISAPAEVMRRNADANLAHWNHAFDKLFIFDLIEYDKLVYLDSDMLVLKNIDALFERPHMSAVIAGKSFPGNEKWVDLNAGLMVVEPERGLRAKLVDTLPASSELDESVSDQTLLQRYFSRWPQSPQLHLEERYNIFIDTLDYYVEHLGYSLFGKDGIIVLHFIGATKPWHRSVGEQFGYLNWLRRNRRFQELIAGLMYMRFQLPIQLRLRMRFRRGILGTDNRPSAKFG